MSSFQHEWIEDMTSGRDDDIFGIPAVETTMPVRKIDLGFRPQAAVSATASMPRGRQVGKI
jgi:hypothetical protein